MAATGFELEREWERACRVWEEIISNVLKRTKGHRTPRWQNDHPFSRWGTSLVTSDGETKISSSLSSAIRALRSRDSQLGLDPEDWAGAIDRVRQIADAANEANPTGRGALLRDMTALFRAMENGRRAEDEIQALARKLHDRWGESDDPTATIFIAYLGELVDFER